jgi:hypothetical protein
LHPARSTHCLNIKVSTPQNRLTAVSNSTRAAEARFPDKEASPGCGAESRCVAAVVEWAILRQRDITR